MKLLSDYIFSPALRYEAHRLIYTPENADSIELSGIMGAAVLAALLVDTPEGDARGIAVDTDAERNEFYDRYEREVRRDGWGILGEEIRRLSESYIELAVSNVPLSELCPNPRIYSLAMELVVSYMQRLVREVFCDHIWECFDWRFPFAKWLWDASHVETRRQRLMSVDWTDPAQVKDIADRPNITEYPTLTFTGERATDIMQRYLDWTWDDYLARVAELPGTKPNAIRHRTDLVASETDWSFLSDEIADLSAGDVRLWHSWEAEWKSFVSAKLLPKREIRFWTSGVTDQMHEHLVYYLRKAEKKHAHYRFLTASVYALRQLCYVRRKCSEKDMMAWLSEYLDIDYTLKNNASQFRRAWREHGRYTPDVKNEVSYLESIGFTRLSTLEPESPERNSER